MTKRWGLNYTFTADIFYFKEKKMVKPRLTGKSKVIIAIMTLSLFVIAGIVSLILVLAATTYGVLSNISVNYVSRSVEASVTGKYWYTGTEKTAMGSAVTFTAADTSSSKERSPSGNINLTTDNNKVYFEYAITNLSEDFAFTVELTNSPKIQAAGVETANFSNVTEKYYVSPVEIPASLLSAMELLDTLNVQPIMKQAMTDGVHNDTVYIYVVASISNTANVACYNGMFTWEFERLNTTNNPIVQIHLNNGSGTMSPSSMDVVTGTYGASNKTINMPVIFEIPSYGTNMFTGYYSATIAGTKYLGCNGSVAHSNKTTSSTDMTASTTLYAVWNEDVIVSSGVLTGLSSSAQSKSIIEIPEGVTSIGEEALADNTTVTSISLPVSLTSIGDRAFYGCTNLEEVNFDSVSAGSNVVYSGSSNLTSIGEEAFYGCISLTHIEIPGSVTTLSERMFDGCTNLHDITAPIYSIMNPVFEGGTPVDYSDDLVLDHMEEYGYLEGLDDVDLTINGNGTSIPVCAFIACDNVKSITLPSSVTTISFFAFAGCSSAISILLPSSLTTIGEGAFIACTSLTTIVIPSGVTSLPKEVFENCTELVNIALPSSMTSIGESAFTGCTNLATVALPSSLTTLGKNAFEDCYLLREIIIPSGVTVISECVFSDCQRLENVVIPLGVTTIENYAFEYCNSLSTLTLPSSLTTIGNNAFEHCISFETVELPSSLTSIGESAFIECSALTHMTIPSSVASLSIQVFRDCTSLATVTLSSGLTTICGNAFRNCSSLANITIPSGVTTIGESAFEGCTSLPSVTLPSSLTSLCQWAFYGCSSLTTLTFAPQSTLATIGENAFEYCTNLPTVTIPSSVTTIDTAAFKNCSELATVTIGSSVVTIGSSAFEECRLSSVTIPSSVRTIDSKAFEDCDYLYTLTFETGVTTIGDRAFYDCDNIRNVTIPSSVTTIGDRAFYDCDNIYTLTLGSGVRTIGARAFYSAYLYGSLTLPSSLTTIGESAFCNTGFSGNLVFPSGLTTIGESAFEACNNITAVSIPSSVTSIGAGAFAECRYIKDLYYNASLGDFGDGGYYLFTYAGWYSNSYNGMDVVIGKDVTRIPSKLFQANLDSGNVRPVRINSLTFESGSSVTSIGDICFTQVFFNSYAPIVFPETLKYVNDKAFKGSTIKNVVMKGVTTIGAEAFYNCEHLESVTIRDVTSISTSKAFKYCYNLFEIYQLGSGITLTAQNSLTYTGSSENGYISTRAKVINTSDSTPSNYVNYNGVRYYNDNGNYIATGAVNVRASSVTISHSSCTKINDFAFEYCDSLSSVTISSPVTYIGEEAFSHTYLSSITIPSTVTKMDKLVFAGRSSITVTFAASGTWTIKYQDGTTVNSSYTPAASTYRTYFTTEDEDHGGYYWIKN